MREFSDLLCEFSMYTTGGAPYKKHIDLRGDFRVESYATGEGEFASVILECDGIYSEEVKSRLALELAKKIRMFFKKNKIPKHGLVLVVGVGNEELTVDALGSKVLPYLKITEQFFAKGLHHAGMGRLAGIRGSVSGVTGISSFDMVKAVVDRIRPACLVVADTLSCKYASRLNRVIQVTDMGLVTGSGVGNAKTALCKETLGVPVISLGVPLVMQASNIVSGYIADGIAKVDAKGARTICEELRGMFLTTNDIDLKVEQFAEIIASGINSAVHGEHLG